MGASEREREGERGGEGALALAAESAAECSGALPQGREQGGDATVQGVAALGCGDAAAVGYVGGGRAVRAGVEESWQAGGARSGRGEECEREWDPSDAEEEEAEDEALEGSFADHQSDACSVTSLYSRTRYRV